MKEKISALLDADLEEHELATALDELSRNEELMQVWERYHLIGATLRNELGVTVDPGLADRIAAKLQGEPTRLAPRRRAARRPGRIRKHVASVAIAAAVATVAIISLQPDAPQLPVVHSQTLSPQEVAMISLQPDTPQGTGNAALVADSGLARAPVAPTGVTRWGTLSPEFERTLNVYLMEHGEFQPHTGLSGLTSYARFVGYNANH